MPHILAVIKKELKMYFNSPIAYIVIVVFLTASFWLFFHNFFLIGQVSMRGYFVFLPWLFLFILSAVTMRLWSEEKKQQTLEVLLSWPAQTWEIVLGKFFASMTVIIIMMAITAPAVFFLKTLGNLDLGVVAASYIGTLFLAGAYLAIGLWVSSLTQNQIIAFIIAIAISFAFFIIGEDFVLVMLPNFLAGIFDFLGIGTHFEAMNRGVLDTRDILYYLSIIGFFLYQNVVSLEKHR